MSADDYMSSRLGEMLQDLRVRQIEPETEQLSSADRLLATDESLWATVQKAREAKYQAEIRRQELHEVHEALNEAAEIMGMSKAEIEERIANANARGISGPINIAAEYPEGRSRAEMYEEDRQRMAADEAAFQEIVAGNRQMIAREEARAAELRGDPIPGNHSDSVPVADE